MPGTDAWLLLAMIHVLIEEDLCTPGPLAEHLSGLDTIEELAKEFTPEMAAERCGIAADEIGG